MVAFAGLSADARVLVDFARCECGSYKLSLEDPASIGHIARCIADVKQVINFLIFVTNIYNI